MSAKAGFLGAKLRLTIPIPYVAPFLEAGLGTTFGEMSTRTASVDEHFAGVTYHIPIGLGLALGKEHNFEVMFSYLFHPAQKQVAGAIAAGMAFKIDGCGCFR